MAERQKDGSYKWTDEEETQIEMSKEARVRAMRQRDAERAKSRHEEDCADGDHVADKDGKCKHCGAKVDKKPPKDDKAPVRDLRKSLL